VIKTNEFKYRKSAREDMCKKSAADGKERRIVKTTSLHIQRVYNKYVIYKFGGIL
jgi:hypothetical protein